MYLLTTFVTNSSLSTFARTLGAKDKKDRKRKALKVAGALVGTALLGAAAYKNKNKLGQLLKKKANTTVKTVTQKTPNQILALPAVGQSSSKVNKVKNTLDNVESNSILITPANMTKKEINSSKVLARKEALGQDLKKLKYTKQDIKQDLEDITDTKYVAKHRTEIPIKMRAYMVKSSKRSLKENKQKLSNTKQQLKSKVDNLRKSNPSLYHLNKLIMFSKNG